MPGVPMEFAEHALNVFPGVKLVKQSIRRLSEPRVEAIGIEDNRLLDANFIREIKGSEWLANTGVVLKKEIDSLWMCGGFISLSKYCPKGQVPLARIGQICDSSGGCDHRRLRYSCSGY